MLTKTLSVLTILAIFNCEAFQQSVDKDSSGNMAQEIKSAIPDFMIPSDVIRQHEKLKKEVTDFLLKLSEKSQGLVIEKVEQEMKSTLVKIVGRVMVIGFDVFSIILPSNPVTDGIGNIIGYLVLGGSTWYEMRCSNAHSEKLKNIQTQLEAELSRYTESQEKVFRELDKLDVFQAGKDFEENLDVIKSLVRNAERQAGEKLSHIKKFLNKLENAYNNLDDVKKNKLDSVDFLMTFGSLLGDAYNMDAYNMDNTSNMADIIAAGSSILGSTIAKAVVNSYLVTLDIKNFIEFFNMRQDLKAEDQRKLDVLKNPKFEDEIKMRDLIMKIRDTILEHGY